MGNNNTRRCGVQQFLSQRITIRPVLLGIACALILSAQKPPVGGSRDLQYTEEKRPVGQPVVTAVPRGHALVIGVGKYPRLTAEQQLKFAESDAEAIYRVLISQEGGGIPPENVRKLIGSQATVENVRKSLEEWLPNVASEGDRVIVYFAGHGYVKNGKGYLAPYDFDPQQFEGTSYPMAGLGSILANKVKARWKLLLTDACHSGKITPATTVDAFISSLGAPQHSFLTLTASRGTEQSFEDADLGGGYGVFTYFLEKGWYGAANRNNDPIVTADELIDYVRNNVKEYLRQRGAMQTPQESPDFDPDMILGFNAKHGAPEGVPLASGDLLIEANMEGVQVYLDDRPVGSVSPASPLQLPGIPPGKHVLKGVKTGYDPDVKHIQVVPGRRETFTLRIQFARRRKQAAEEFFERGLKLYETQKNAGELERAAVEFSKALERDPTDRDAAFYGCLSRQLLGDTEAALAACKTAVSIDPDYPATRNQYAVLLLETGDTAEAIRQLSESARIDAKNTITHSHLAQAYRMAAAYDKSIEAAGRAVALDSGNAQAYLWRAESLRMAGNFANARDEYRRYLELNNFDASLGETLRYHLIGFGATKRRADQRQFYGNQQYLAYAGICECEQRLGNLMRARSYCQKALKIDPRDSYTFFFLGKIHSMLFNLTKSRRDLMEARRNYEQVVAINPDLEESKQAKSYISQIDGLLARLK